MQAAPFTETSFRTAMEYMKNGLKPNDLDRLIEFMENIDIPYEYIKKFDIKNILENCVPEEKSRKLLEKIRQQHKEMCTPKKSGNSMNSPNNTLPASYKKNPIRLSEKETRMALAGLAEDVEDEMIEEMEQEEASPKNIKAERRMSVARRLTPY